PGDTVSYIVEWDDPWDDSAAANDPNGDYDAVLFNSSGAAIACNQGMNVSTTNGQCNQTNSQPLNTPGPQPIQGNQWQNTGTSPASVYLEIFLVNGTPGPNPGNLGNQFKILIASQMSNVIQVTPNTPAGSIFGQSAVGNAEPSTATPGEITVGAVPASNASSIEPYSSQGPVQFGIPGTGTGTQPAETIQKPDFVATDCVSVTGVASFGSPFCGTSAAAPHIAGLIALLLSAYPSTDNPYTLLQNSASQPAGGINPNGIYGYGLPNMMTLLASGTYPATSAVITSPASGASVSSGQKVAFAGSCLGYDGSNAFTYDWNFGSSGLPDSSEQNPSVTFTTAGSYTVKLTCTNKTGSGSATSSITVTASRFGGGGSLGWLTLTVLLLLQLIALRRKDIA
ncbi:MAG: PKD domain-containing protein, partial [Gammaproteobacteria bacterium]|nr:PKD domain-containing protein [Gammaproteobacteria bacterium]